MAVFRRGQLMTGVRYSYHLVQPAHRRSNNVWIASMENRQADIDPAKVVIKSAIQVLLQNETKHLNALRGSNRIRQIIDTVVSTPAIVLEYVEGDLRSLSIRRKLERIEIKTIAKQLLEALAFAHARNIVHTDIKPQNILLSGFRDGVKYPKRSIKLADFANASEPSDHQISPKAFRSPESWLGLPWGTPADIWSFGAVMGSLMMGPYGELFGSSAKDDEDASIEILRKTNSMIGPYPLALLERAGGDWPALFKEFADMDEEEGGSLTWKMVVQDLKLPEGDGAFIERVLKIDPAERPTADALLKDEWLAE
ncbi:hypothetical protein VTL71DRAFT_9678 [Oculimacula yallundae]|uniref:Protein kinase domain-containing protein n=1 Tax=Oculimacula yallundae TaxID=86028 RepID=A0ABR4BRH9_9HELO